MNEWIYILAIIVISILCIIFSYRKKLFDGTWYIWYVIIIDVLFIGFLFLYKLGYIV